VATKQELRLLHAEYARTRDPEIRKQLVDHYGNLVHFLARKFMGRGEPLDDIVQVGYIGLLMAIERFEPERELEFSTFATPTIVGEIKRHFRDKSWAIKIPRRLQETYQQVLRAQEKLQTQLGHQPVVAEIAEYLNITQEEVLAALEVSPAQRTLSFEAGATGRADDDGLLMSERLGREDENLEKVELQNLIGQAMQHLTARERRIMYLRFVEQLPQAEVAKRLGISQMHVSRLQRAAVEHLKKDMPTA
jgi:RNA polymerase sigma-B factor